MGKEEPGGYEPGLFRRFSNTVLPVRPRRESYGCHLDLKIFSNEDYTLLRLRGKFNNRIPYDYMRPLEESYSQLRALPVIVDLREVESELAGAAFMASIARNLTQRAVPHVSFLGNDDIRHIFDICFDDCERVSFSRSVGTALSEFVKRKSA